MLTKQEKNKLRNKLFRHLDGIVVAPAAYTLMKHSVTDYLLSHETVSLEELTDKFKANNGYLNVALRTLASQGWVTQHIDNKNNKVTFSTNKVSETAFEHFHLYKDVVELIQISENYHNRLFEMEPFLKLENTFKNYINNFGVTIASNPATKTIQEQILVHIEGAMVGPTLVHLGMSGMFHKYFMESRFKPEEFHKDSEGFERLLDILTELNWFNKINGAYEFTKEGLFFAKRASAYGVTVSYIPTLRKLDDLIFGNPLILKNSIENGNEMHVDREMNVWGSGGAHTAYFREVDNIIIDLFNQPIEKQPKGILDMGCGNGAFLQHLFSVIYNNTERGKVLDEYPLTLIGVDYNQAAINISRKNLIQADIWAKVIWGDIGKPDLLAQDLKEKYNIELKDLLNVRTFLDHNRMWEEPKKTDSLTNTSSTGSYAHEGKKLNNNLVAESLKQHFNKWAPYVEKHGLLLIELHTLKPELTAKNIGKTAATAYDATHGYSDQYILELDEFIKVIEETGLCSEKDKFKKYPNSELATVSINLFKAK